jgi:murein DD-endopeptidase MepM/ murein hydrolase activator NlpD
LSATRCAVGLLLLWAWGSAGAQSSPSLPYRHESCSENGRVCLIIEQPDTESATLTLRTKATSELTVTLDAEVENVELSTPLPVTAVFEGSQTKTLVRLRRAKRGLAWRYKNVHYKWNWGTARARHDDSVLYLLPFEPNHAVRVIQGYDGGISHTGPMRYALDFDLLEGSLVRAARDGVVADAIHTFKTAGTDKSYREQDKANRVLVRHADGTFGYYGHLKPGGVFVREGQSVTAGQPLAISGNTGYSRGPHLHFEVRTAVDGTQWQTFPVRFTTQQGRGLTLEQDKSYSAAR